MPICLIIVNSKNKQSLFNFLFFLVNSLKVSLISRCEKKKGGKKVITVLKSPHINKNAQEQFELRNFNNKFLFFSHNTPKCFIILKAIKTKLFPDIKIKLKFFINNNTSLKFNTKVFNPNNFTLGVYKLNFISQKLNNNQKYNYNKIISMKLTKKTKNYLKIFDSYGEFSLQI